ncbi:MAG: glutamine--fructose-6-phosphate transaminase (isomerizing), partial [Prevotellaceae bacterium]|nr:glutamine--fructose-6-phosphate transaminase (isomerizing) [Prevotellaceae bacterium]
LRRLEYRGYDSAGCAMLSAKDGSLNVYKAKGRVSDLERNAEGKDVSGTIGIAHTRWATHGVPSEINAHPHVSKSGNLTLVHNGIIENYATLREQLKERGYSFKSETDTEVLVQLIEYVMDTNDVDLPTAVRGALSQVFGAYAIAVIDRRHPDVIVAARKSSPLAVGIVDGNTEFFLASDASPIAEYTKHIVYLNDEELAVMTRGKGLEVLRLDGEHTSAEVQEVNVDLSMLDHDGFPHFMLKEIFDQPNVLKDCIRGRIVESPYSHAPQVVLSAVTNNRRQLLQAKRIVIVSCGTSWHAGLIGKQLIEHFCRIPVEVAYASEFRYSDPVIGADDVVMAISQSGETADTLAAIQLAKRNGALIFGIVNGVGSSIARESDTGTYIHVGPEIGVASTKAFTGQVTVLVMLALALGMAKGTVEQDEYETTIKELLAIPDKIKKILEQNDKIKNIAQTYTFAHNFLYLGRGWNYPVALEGALKLKEISYIHAEGYPAAEMKHGPIALVDAEMPVVFIATHHKLYQKIISNMQEVVSRHGSIIAIVTEGDEQVKNMVKEVIEVPHTLAC